MEWIEFSESDQESTPPYYRPVACTDGKDRFTCWLAWDEEPGYIWTINGTDIVREGITHWMPLPEPPG